MKSRLLSFPALKKAPFTNGATEFCEPLKRHINKEVRNISMTPAIVQAAKGVFSAGPVMSSKYALRKLGIFAKSKLNYFL